MAAVLRIMLALALPVPALAQAAIDPVAATRCRDKPGAFGCANAHNLAAMAAPEDLVAGRPISPASGVQEAAAVARLDADKVKDLRREGMGKPE